MINTIRCYLNTIGLRGLLSAIRAKLQNSIILHELGRQDVKHNFYLRIPTSDIPTYEQIFLNNCYEFLVKTTPNVIVDAGANIGLSAIYFANKYPNAKIIAIEPEASNFEMLKLNVSPYSNIIPLQAALWCHNNQINVLDSGMGKFGFTAEERCNSINPSAQICHQINAITIDKILDIFRLNRICILKVDIEGAEKEVFKDPSLWIDKVDSIIIELHETIKRGCIKTFYKSLKGFDNEWHQGENVFVSRRGRISPKTDIIL